MGDALVFNLIKRASQPEKLNFKKLCEEEKFEKLETVHQMNDPQGSVTSVESVFRFCCKTN